MLALRLLLKGRQFTFCPICVRKDVAKTNAHSVEGDEKSGESIAKLRGKKDAGDCLGITHKLVIVNNSTAHQLELSKM